MVRMTEPTSKMIGDRKFPKPWRMERADPDTFIVVDANGTKLFYIAGDEGDGDNAAASVLFHTNDEEDHAYLVEEVATLLDVEQ
jgi:hypothetical protein